VSAAVDATRWRLQLLAAIALACGTLAGLTACAGAPYLLIPDVRRGDRVSARETLLAHPLPPGQNIQATLLGRTESLSYHLVQIRDREQPHLHATHDLVVTLLVGNGELHAHGTRQRMEGGDVAVIPRGVPHYFVNTGTAPAAAFVTMAPPGERPDEILVLPAP